MVAELGDRCACGSSNVRHGARAAHPGPRAAVPLRANVTGCSGGAGLDRRSCPIRPGGSPAAVERQRIQHSQLVPTMFVRLLKLPEQLRTHSTVLAGFVVHAAAPAPGGKRQMIDWWARSCGSTTAARRPAGGGLHTRVAGPPGHGRQRVSVAIKITPRTHPGAGRHVREVYIGWGPTGRTFTNRQRREAPRNGARRFLSLGDAAGWTRTASSTSATGYDMVISAGEHLPAEIEQCPGRPARGADAACSDPDSEYARRCRALDHHPQRRPRTICAPVRPTCQLQGPEVVVRTRDLPEDSGSCSSRGSGSATGTEPGVAGRPSRSTGARPSLPPAIDLDGEAINI